MMRKSTGSPITVSIADIDDTGRLRNTARNERNTSMSAELSGGDVDARWDQAESGGEEAVGGSAPTPDQDEVDEIGKAAGVTYEEGEPLRVGAKEEDRDKHRWELDPASAEDYPHNAAPAARDAVPVRKMEHHDQYKRSR